MDAIETMLTRAQDYADAMQHEARLRIVREETEGEIAASLMGTPNAETGKPHSATSAREAARNAPAVVAQRVALLTAERETILARARYEAARIAAWQTVHVVAGVA